MRKFGLNNILGNQTKKPDPTTGGAIDDNPSVEKPVTAPAPRKYSAYRTILNRHNETAARLHSEPAASIDSEPLPFDESPVQPEQL